MSKAFTLIELLVVIGIISILTALVLPDYRAGDENLALQRSAHKLARDLRGVQEMAISAREFAGEVPSGYGVYFNLNQPDIYILFADLDGDKSYSGPSEKKETIALEKQIRIVNLNPVSLSSLSIVFTPPDPSIFFTPDASLSSVTIKALGTEQQKVIRVNKAGLIYVE